MHVGSQLATSQVLIVPIVLSVAILQITNISASNPSLPSSGWNNLCAVMLHSAVHCVLYSEVPPVVRPGPSPKLFFHLFIGGWHVQRVVHVSFGEMCIEWGCFVDLCAWLSKNSFLHQASSLWYDDANIRYRCGQPGRGVALVMLCS